MPRARFLLSKLPLITRREIGIISKSEERKEKKNLYFVFMGGDQRRIPFHPLAPSSPFSSLLCRINAIKWEKKKKKRRKNMPFVPLNECHLQEEI